MKHMVGLIIRELKPTAKNVKDEFHHHEHAHKKVTE